MSSFSVVLAAVVGFLAARMLWLAVRKSWATPALLRRNYRGMQLPTAAGIIIPLALLLIEGLRAVFGAIGLGEEGGFSPARAAGLVVIMGFAALGLLDDFLGDSTKAKGIGGHLKALKQGEFTTGAIKLFGGVALALIGAAFVSAGNIGGLIVDAAVIALAANLANQLDLRPGRTTKVTVIAFIIMAAVSGLNPDLVPVAIAVGAAVAILLDEMHERLMLGDTGSNALGAVMGLGIVATTGTSGALIAAVVLLALTLIGDSISFTKIFEKVGPLRAFDNLGRRSNAPSSGAPAAATAQPRSAQPEPEPEPEYEEEAPKYEAPNRPDPTIDLRQATPVAPPSPPRVESNSDEMATTVGTANVGAPASSFSTREQSSFSSLRSGESSATRRTNPSRGEATPSDRGRYDDEFEDAPDFFAPRRPGEPRVEQRPLSDRFHSPFDDDEDDI